MLAIRVVLLSVEGTDHDDAGGWLRKYASM